MNRHQYRRSVSPPPHLCLRPLPRLPLPLHRPKSFPLNVFADPHPLNPVPSILYKNIGGRGHQLFHRSLLSPIFRTLFQVPYPVSPVFATLTKTPGTWGYSSHFGTGRYVDALTRRRLPRTSSTPIPHGATVHRSLAMIPLTTSLRRCFLASSPPKRTVAFPQHGTSRPLCSAPPPRTIQVHAGAKRASHAWALTVGSRNRSTPTTS